MLTWFAKLKCINVYQVCACSCWKASTTQVVLCNSVPLHVQHKHDCPQKVQDLWHQLWMCECGPDLCCCISSGRFSHFVKLLDDFTQFVKDITVELAAHCDHVREFIWLYNAGLYAVACMSLHQISKSGAHDYSCRERQGKGAWQLYRHQHLLGSYDLTCCCSGAGLSDDHLHIVTWCCLDIAVVLRTTQKAYGRVVVNRHSTGSRPVGTCAEHAPGRSWLLHVWPKKVCKQVMRLGVWVHVRLIVLITFMRSLLGNGL